MPNAKLSVRAGEFLPSRHGFRFSNHFPAGPVVNLRLPGLTLPFGNASYGLCGGMAFAARDYFDKGITIPQTAAPPDPGSPLFNYLVRRLWDSFQLPGGPFRYYAWMGLSDEAVLVRTVSEGWPRIRRELDRGRLAPLGALIGSRASATRRELLCAASFTRLTVRLALPGSATFSGCNERTAPRRDRLLRREWPLRLHRGVSAPPRVLLRERLPTLPLWVQEAEE
jgi:hypothetical protein